MFALRGTEARASTTSRAAVGMRARQTGLKLPGQDSSKRGAFVSYDAPFFKACVRRRNRSITASGIRSRLPDSNAEHFGTMMPERTKGR